jgi:ankyrin repeat protein
MVLWYSLLIFLCHSGILFAMEEPASKRHRPLSHTEQQEELNKDLGRAIIRNDLPEVQRLVENGAQVNALIPRALIDSQNTAGFVTPVYIAAGRGLLPIVTYLVQHGASLHTPTIGFREGATPLHYAAAEGHLSVVQYLLNQGADIHAKLTDTDDSYPGATALHYAALRGHLPIVRYLVEHGKAPVNAQATGVRQGLTPLHYSALGGHRDINYYLLTQGAFINVPLTAGPFQGATPLDFALRENHPYAAYDLIKYGASVKPEQRNNILLWKSEILNAVLKDNRAVIDELIARFSTNMLNEALAYAIGQGKDTLVEYLISKGADLRQGLKQVNTILRMAHAYERPYASIRAFLVNRLSLKEQLLSKPELKAVLAKGFFILPLELLLKIDPTWALLRGILTGTPDTVLQALQAGANANAVDDHTIAMLYRAATYPDVEKSYEMTRLLIEYKAVIPELLLANVCLMQNAYQRHAIIRLLIDALRAQGNTISTQTSHLCGNVLTVPR